LLANGPPGLRIAAANSDDIAELLALYQNLNPDDPPLDAEFAQGVFRRLTATGCTKILGARLDEALVGTCAITIIANLTCGGRSYAPIENVVTHADYRRRGIGRALLEASLARARKENCYKVMLATGSRRPETLRFYESVGFAMGVKTYFEARPNASQPR